MSVAADASGNVYVADRGNHRIQKFTTAGAFLASWDLGSLCLPQDVATDASGHVYVAGCKLQKRTATGTLIAKWDLGAFIAANASGSRVYAAKADFLDPSIGSWMDHVDIFNCLAGS